MNADSPKPAAHGVESAPQLSLDAKQCLLELVEDIGFSFEAAEAAAEQGMLVLGSVVVYFFAVDAIGDSAWTLVIQDINPEVRKASLDADMLGRYMRINGTLASLQSAAFGLGKNEILELVFHSKMMPRQVNLLTIALASSLLLWRQCTAAVENVSQKNAPPENQAHSLESLEDEIANLNDLNLQESAFISNTLSASGVDIADAVTAKLDIALSQKLLPFVTAQGISTALAKEMAQSGRMRIHGVSLKVLSDGIGEECIFVADLKHSYQDSDITYLKAALSASSILMKSYQASVARWGNNASIVLRCQWPLISAEVLTDILDNLYKLAVTFGTTFISPNLHHFH
jgi:hypothetical protein